MPGTGELPEQLRVSVYLGDFPLCPPMTRSHSAQKPARQLVRLPDGGGDGAQVGWPVCLDKGALFLKLERFRASGQWPPVMRCDAFGSVWPRDRCVLGKESEVSRKRELEALAAAQKEEVSWQKEGRVNGGRVERIFSDVLDL